MKVFRHVMRGAFTEKCWADWPHAAPASLYEVPQPGRHFEKPNKHILLQLQGLLIYVSIQPNTFWERANDQLLSSTIMQHDTFVFMEADSLGPPYFWRIVKLSLNQCTMCLFKSPLSNFASEKLKLSFGSFSVQTMSKSHGSTINSTNVEKNTAVPPSACVTHILPAFSLALFMAALILPQLHRGRGTYSEVEDQKGQYSKQRIF